MTGQTAATDQDELRRLIAANPVWYHTMELAPGITTPGWFDLRPIVERLPWPEIDGRRCLDVGTYDGFLAFEMERRGALEVVATDIADHADWDWPPDVRARGSEELAHLAGPEKGVGFRIAHGALGSRVEKVAISIYELAPDRVGMFDVVVCGSLLLHLRDPLRALEALRRVCGGLLLSAEAIDLWLSIVAYNRPAASLNGIGSLCQWWTPNVMGHRQMIASAGFEILRTTRPYSVPFGVAHPPPDGSFRSRKNLALQRVMAGSAGVPHAAVLARPAV
jgi:tRNA (mo5U34)-methyltransferase